MNKYTATTMKEIQDAITDYQHNIKKTLHTYRQQMQKAEGEAAAFKDEKSYIADKKAKADAIARLDIQSAEYALCTELKHHIAELRTDLHKHLTTAPPEKFTAALRTYSDFGLKPSIEEVRAMLELAAGNTLGIRALNSVLRKNNMKPVTAPDATDFEADLAALDRLAEGNFMWSDSDHLHELGAIFKGMPQPERMPNGNFFTGGRRWDDISIIIATGDFNERVKALDEMQARWSENVLPTYYDAEVYESPEEFVEDYQATAQAAQIEPGSDDGIPTAIKKNIERQAAANAKAADVWDMYATGKVKPIRAEANNNDHADG